MINGKQQEGGNTLPKTTKRNGEISARPSLAQQNGSLYLNDLIDNLSDAFIATDIHFNITQWNKAAERVYGWSSAEVMGNRFSDVIKTEYEAGDDDSAYQEIIVEGVWSNKVIQPHKDGRKISIFSTVSVVKNGAGDFIGLVAINRDITEQKVAEERFRLAVEAAPNAIIMVAENGEIILINSQAEKYFGYQRSELIGASIDRLVPNQYTAIHSNHRAEFLSAPQKRNMGVGRDLYALRKDGSEFPVEIGLAPITTDEGTFVLATIVDITERQQAEERFHLAVESAPNAILMVNQYGSIVMVNSQAENYFGYQRAAMIGESVDMLVPVRYAELHPAHRAGFFSDPQMRDMGVGRDLHALRSDGSEFPVEIGLAPITTAEGTFVLATIVDITERMQTEEEMHRLNKELESFAYSISHDLRAPLRSIDGFSEMLVEKYSAALEGDGLHFLSRIQVNVRRMGHMIEDMLALAQMTRHELQFQTVNLSEIVRDILEELIVQEPGRSIRFEIEEQLAAWCDAGLIRIVFQNLLGNSIKFTSKRADTLIEFGCDAKKKFGKKVYFVRDNGVGFNMAYADKMFNAFQRLHTVDEFPGTGIGLATVQRIIHRHGGQIWVEAAPGQGATFYFVLGDLYDQS